MKGGDNVDFYGYRRPDGQIGVRNYIGIIPSVFCAGRVAELISRQVTNTVFLQHPVGCSQVGADLERTAKTLIAMGNHPNLAGVLVVGLGCERFTVKEFVEGLKKSGKPVESVIIQEEGDSIKAVAKGVALAKKMLFDVSNLQREAFDISNLCVGVKCGGTDATSGIAANPAVGIMSDMLVDRGGTVIFSEVTELLGADDILAARAINNQVATDIRNTIARMEEKLRIAGTDPRYQNRSALISTGNFDGGVSTVVEKALGNIYKSGSRPIRGVIDYCEKPHEPGLYLMDSPGHDGEVVTGMIGGGAQIIVFTSGRGTPTGFPFVPVIKVTGNNRTYIKMQENIDYNAGGIIEGKNSILKAGEDIFNIVVETANGNVTKAEALGHAELFCVSRL